MTLLTNDIKTIFSLQGCVIEKAEIDYSTFELRIYVHLQGVNQNRCPVCGKKCPGYDRATYRKEYRTIDFGVLKTFIVIDLCRIECPEHGILTQAVPFAFHKSRFTKLFEKQVIYLAGSYNKTKVSEIMRINWATVGHIISRVWAVKEPKLKNRFDNLKRLGIDETSYQKGHKYLTTVMNLDTNEILFAAVGHDGETLSAFFEQLTPEQRESVEFVAGDAASWIKKTAEAYCPNAKFCLDKFHVSQWAVGAVDEVRREEWRDLRSLWSAMKKDETTDPARLDEVKEQVQALKKSKYTLGCRFNPENLYQIEKLTEIRSSNPRIFRAWSLKELLRAGLSAHSREEAEDVLKSFLSWASHSRLKPMVKLAKSIREHKEDILRTVEYGITSAQVEAMNNKIKLIQRTAYGFRNIQNLIDMIMLYCSSVGRNLKAVYADDPDFENTVYPPKSARSRKSARA